MAIFSIILRCDPAEHRDRIANEDREGRGKLRDPESVAKMTARPLVRAERPRSIELDVTMIAAEDAASRFIEWMNIPM